MTAFFTRALKDEYVMEANKAIELRSVSKSYQLSKTAARIAGGSLKEFQALKDITLDVRRGQIFGIIGRNGAGKTTLLNIIVGVLSATGGEINVCGKALGLFNLGVGFQDEFTGRENIFLNGAIVGATRDELNNKLHSIIEFSELGDFIDMPLGSYSQGMRLRLGFSIIANLEFNILVIDEVLAVGDSLFQNKCFQRLMDFKRQGKTLVITTQSMDLIERLCDKVALLNHGLLLFCGGSSEAISRYYELLSTEKFFIAPQKNDKILIENTKKWAEDMPGWDKKFGTKEVIIESVEFVDKLGRKSNKIRSGDTLKVKVGFNVRNAVREPHFGVAIFRNDGVYCYGPNTVFDGYEFSKFKEGGGYFILNYHKLLLAPGEYKVSVAIWDKEEAVAFDYHCGHYKLVVEGADNKTNELLNIPFKFQPASYPDRVRPQAGRNSRILDLSSLSNNWGVCRDDEKIKVLSVRLFNQLGQEKNVFLTNEPVSLNINFCGSSSWNNSSYLWVGIYRDDKIYCQGITAPLGKNRNFNISFSKFPLLPGGYRVSLGIWDSLIRKFLMYHHGIYSFRMAFDRQDHGTVYLEHKWRWCLPK